MGYATEFVCVVLSRRNFGTLKYLTNFPFPLGVSKIDGKGLLLKGPTF